MLQTKYRRWIAAMTIGTLAFAVAGHAPAQDKKPEKHDGAVLNQTLRDVINAGAILFNDQGDHAGCYRLYQGSLLTLRPFVPADQQLSIDKGLAAAEKMATFAARAYELRRVLDELRTKSKGSAEKDKQKDENKIDENNSAKGQIAGKLLFEGKSVAGGYSVTLISGQGKAFSTPIQKDGSFQFKTPIPIGDYRVTVERIAGAEITGPGLPSRYSSPDTSGLTVRVQGGKQQVDLNLVK